MSGASHPWKIPDTWVWVRIGEVADVVGGGTPPTTNPSNFDGGTVPWVTPADLSGYVQKYISRGKRNITTAGLKNSAARLLPKGTVLFSSRAPIGYVAVASNPLSTNQGFKSFVLPAELDPEYVYYYLQRAKHLAVALSSGTTFQEISGRKAAQLPLPIATQGDQHRIVESIESYLTRLDDAVATLERVQRNLKRYRASVLKAAVEGRLVPTEAELSRAEGRDYEPASVLLERILAERRRRWEEAELAKMKARGKAPKDDKWKAKYREPDQAQIGELSTLPQGWVWATIDALAEIQGGITKGQKQKPGEVYREVPYLRVANVQRGFLDLSEIKTIKATEARIDELRLISGDVLFNEGGDRDKLGRGWVWGGEVPECIHQNHVFRARIYGDGMLSELLSWYGNTNGQSYFFDEGKQTTNLASINLTKLRALPVPVPPRAEQARIRETIEQHLSVADNALRSISAELARCARLRQSILKWAFEGRLVDQDPTDDPASVLLDRIRAEREAAPARPSGSLRRTPAWQGDRG